MSVIVPRYYQTEADEAIFQFFRDHPDPDRNPVVAMPTGTGKAVQIAMFCKRVLTTWPGQRITMLVDSKELVAQNADKLRSLWPQAPLGIYSSGLKSKQYSMPITFAGIQSAVKNPHLFGHQDILIIDECHMVSPEEEGNYKKFINFLKQRNPFLRVIGLSATIYRLGLGMITDNGIFTDVCYDITTMEAFNRLLDEGFLCPLIPMETKVVMDVKGVRKQGGDFKEKDLHSKFVTREITEAALREMMEATWGKRRKTMIFAIDIEHCELIHEILQGWGVRSGYVHSKMTGDRDDVIGAFKTFGDNGIDYLINKDILTKGFDFPALDCLVLLRPTMSPVLHVQMLGRLTRPFYLPGIDLSTTEGRLYAIRNSLKPNGLVLDFAGNTQRLGPMNDPKIPKRKGDGAGDIPIKTCSHCGCMAHISARVCINCGEEFNFEVKITPNASTTELIVRDEPQVEWFDVQRVEYSAHNMNRPDKIPTLKVNYYCGVRRFPEWICLEHYGNSIQRKAHKWWRERSPWEPPPSVAEAIQYLSTARDPLRAPRRIQVWVNKPHPEIMGYEF